MTCGNSKWKKATVQSSGRCFFQADGVSFHLCGYFRLCFDCDLVVLHDKIGGQSSTHSFIRWPILHLTQEWVLSPKSCIGKTMEKNMDQKCKKKTYTFTLHGTVPYPHISRHFWVDDFPNFPVWPMWPFPEVGDSLEILTNGNLKVGSQSQQAVAVKRRTHGDVGVVGLFSRNFKHMGHMGLIHV